MKPSNTTTSGKATDMIAGICTLPRFPCPSTKRHVMLNVTSAAAAAAAATAPRTAGWSCSVFFSFSSNSHATWWWMLYRTLRKVPGTTKVRLWEKNMWVVTPRCAAAAVVSAVVLRRPTKEYTHRYSMIHCRFTTTAGIEVAPHYHQLLVHTSKYLILIVCGHTIISCI